MASEDSFTAASSDPRWYESLKLGSGSCLDLYDLLQTNRGLIHELGPNGKTVLHKGVHHGCVKLVKFVLVEMFDEAGNCNCEREDNEQCGLTREELLRKTDKRGDTAVNIVLVSGSPKMVKLLVWAIEVSKCEHSPSDRDVFDDEGYGINVAKQRTRSSGSVPEVDDELFVENSYAPIIYGSDYMNRAMYEAVYEIIAAELEVCGEYINVVKEKIKVDVNFQFVPIEQIVVHYLVTIAEDSEIMEITNFLRRIIEKCTSNESCGERIVVTLFNILDPQGRTILNLACELLERSLRRFQFIHELFNILDGSLTNYGSPLSKETIERCLRGTDGNGRSLSHIMSSHNQSSIPMWVWEQTLWEKFLRGSGDYIFSGERLDFDLVTNCIYTLHCWCYGSNPSVTLEKWGKAVTSITPLHLSIVLNNHRMFKYLLKIVNINMSLYINYGELSPFQLASILGRTAMVEEFLKHHDEVKTVKDNGFGNSDDFFSAIHYAAMFGRSDTLQMILRYPIYDPICQAYGHGTALHALVGMDIHPRRYDQLKRIREMASHHVLPSSPEYKHIEKDFLLLDIIGNVPRMFTDDEKTCINLLIQGGIDVWTTHNRNGQFPSVNEKGNNAARAWWCEKVGKEVEIKKESITNAANATSVIGALVATTSFIGPLQPPSSYGVEGGYIHMSRKAIQVYLVCNNFSFFFSIASILMGVLPAIPMSKESLYDEMLRSERCLKTAVAFLLVSIMCIIASFSSAGIAVVSPQWHERKYVVISIALGGALCLFVLVIHIIRLLRMVFHKNNWLRRRFARHMYF